MQNFKLILSLVLIGLLVLFVVQNTERLNLEFFIWSFEIRRAFLIFFVLAVGIIIGWVLRGMGQHHRARQESDDDG